MIVGDSAEPLSDAAYAMKIFRLDTKTTFGLNPSNGIGPAGSDSASKQGPATASDRVQLSGLSGYLASALSGSPTHIAKLAELSSSVPNGQYHVDAYAVGGSIIQHSIEFGGGGYSALSIGRPL